MTTQDAVVRRDTVRVFFALAALPAAAALARAVMPTANPAKTMGLTYPDPTGRLADAAAILAGNARVAALVLGATLLAATVPAFVTPMALLLASVASLNVAMLCIVIAGDGTPAAVALLPHGPVELLAFSVLGAGFLHARRSRRQSSPRLVATTTVGGLLLLAVAAALEVTPA